MEVRTIESMTTTPNYSKRCLHYKLMDNVCITMSQKATSKQLDGNQPCSAWLFIKLSQCIVFCISATQCFTNYINKVHYIRDMSIVNLLIELTKLN